MGLFCLDKGDLIIVIGWYFELDVLVFYLFYKLFYNFMIDFVKIVFNFFVFFY